jgi:hypothetical protein
MTDMIITELPASLAAMPPLKGQPANIKEYAFATQIGDTRIEELGEKILGEILALTPTAIYWTPEDLGGLNHRHSLGPAEGFTFTITRGEGEKSELISVVREGREVAFVRTSRINKRIVLTWTDPSETWPIDMMFFIREKLPDGTEDSQNAGDVELPLGLLQVRVPDQPRPLRGQAIQF